MAVVKDYSLADRLKTKIAAREAKLGVIGMGYIGLSLLDAFGKAGYQLWGYDTNRSRVESVKREESYFNFLPLKELFSLVGKGKFHPSENDDILKEADVIFLCVPTSMDEHHLPDLTNLRQAFQTACKHLKKGMLIVLQSSTYPGTTNEEFLPLLEKTGLKVGEDFYLSHVPETADPGNPRYCFNEVPKIISGITPACREVALELYKSAGFKVFPCPSTKVAESAKILQNAFRLVNISFINEMKIMLDRMGVDVWDVIAAASTKPFGFMPFYPSPGAGGDCIPVDSEYLIWKARVTEGPTTLLEMAEHINRSMPHFVIEKVQEGLNRYDKSIHHTPILLLGVSYKKDVNDIRESAALSILFQLKQMRAKVEYHDPFIKKLPPIHRYPEMELQSIDLDYAKLDRYDAIVIGTDHSSYDWDQIVSKSKLVIDPYNATAKVAHSRDKIVKA